MALLEVTGLTVRYRGVVALDNVSLSVGRGEVVGLIGPNGAGKTTLFNVVSGLVPAGAGEVRLDGVDITRASADRRARLGLGRTFQSPQLLSRLSVLDNLLLGCQSRMRGGMLSDGLRLPASYRDDVRARREAEEIADDVGLGMHLHRAVGDLPLGMRRLVEVGRALCGRPRLLLLDEAASGIGRDRGGELAGFFRTLRDRFDLAMLVVEHDLEFVMGLCDFVYVLDFGRLIARGTPEQVRNDPAVAAAYLGREAPSGTSQEVTGAAVG